MVDGLRSLGADIDTGGDAWTITPRPLKAAGPVDVGLAGTVMRFLLPVAALTRGAVRMDGDPRARERPLGALIGALRSLGVVIDDDGRGGLPLTVHGSGQVEGGEVELDASASSQLVSALLLAAPRFTRGLTVRHVGGRLPSLPHLALTVSMLRDRGAEVDEPVPGTWQVAPGPLQGGDVTVEPDLSAAAAFLAAPLVAGGTVRVTGWPSRSHQPGAQTPAVLEEMGATVSRDGDALVVRGNGKPFGINVDLGDNSELACVLAAVAALAGSGSRLTGVAHMRGHETDRLAALAKELGALGADVEELPDGLRMRPATLHGGLFHTYDDHRLAMAGAVLGLAVDGVQVENVATTSKTFPDFAQRWTTMVEGTS
jgi:3-phosphoshikimate 1-carboxyvinyltransferase